MCTLCDCHYTFALHDQVAVTHLLLRLPHRAHTALRLMLMLQLSWIGLPPSLPAMRTSCVTHAHASAKPLLSHAVLNFASRGERSSDSWPGNRRPVVVARAHPSSEALCFCSCQGRLAARPLLVASHQPQWEVCFSDPLGWHCLLRLRRLLVPARARPAQPGLLLPLQL